MRPAEKNAPAGSAWSAAAVRERLVEAFEIELRIPGGRGVTRSSSWTFPVLHEFAEVVHWTDARDRVWEQWARTRGVLPHEFDRWQETVGWFGILRDYPEERDCLAQWAILRARRRPLHLALRRYSGSRSSFYRAVEAGSDRIACRLNVDGVDIG